ncbi:hypothetical protein MMC19_000019 [Ptychographa xylographoides]|nr:hypothetical protein [Ptychographa xylographoides]
MHLRLAQFGNLFAKFENLYAHRRVPSNEVKSAVAEEKQTSPPCPPPPAYNESAPPSYAVAPLAGQVISHNSEAKPLTRAQKRPTQEIRNENFLTFFKLLVRQDYELFMNNSIHLRATPNDTSLKSFEMVKLWEVLCKRLLHSRRLPYTGPKDIRSFREQDPEIDEYLIRPMQELGLDSSMVEYRLFYVGCGIDGTSHPYSFLEYSAMLGNWVLLHRLLEYDAKVLLPKLFKQTELVLLNKMIMAKLFMGSPVILMASHDAQRMHIDAVKNGIVGVYGVESRVWTRFKRY